MPKIIIFCRALDALGISGRIYDRLVQSFGKDLVALVVFDDPITARDAQTLLQDGDISLVAIGQHWLSEIWSENDPARLLVRTAIKSQRLVMPLLVNDARMPSSDQLPPDLLDFAFRNAFKVDPGPAFDDHVSRLTKTLEAIRSQKPRSPSPVAAAIPQPFARTSTSAPEGQSSRIASAYIFISHSSRDRKIGETICRALESRGLQCWISSRDVAGGENYQGSIVQAIRSAKVMVLVFSDNANNSDEIKKELALASRNKLLVIPIRVEDVVPNDALEFELSTRQWIDFFADWEQALETLSKRISSVLTA